jgi:hypothetical protein
VPEANDDTAGNNPPTALETGSPDRIVGTVVAVATT